MSGLQVSILDKDQTVGDWLLKHLGQIGVDAYWVPSVSDLIRASEKQQPALCLLALRPPITQVLGLLAELRQEPRFARTAFVIMGPLQHKHAAFEAGADDYLVTPPDVIELRKRVRLYLDRATLAQRVVAETSITQEMERLALQLNDDLGLDEESISLLQHAATLTEERNRLDLILRHAGEAIALVDPAGKLLYVNPAWLDLIGPTTTARVGEPIIWPPRTDNIAINHAIAAAIQRQQQWHGEARFALDPKNRLDTDTTITPAFDASGELAGFVIIQQDATERKAIEYLRTRFLADAATQMRTPVTNIKMRQYLLRQSPANQHDMHIQALERETERLSRLVEAMTELSRLDTDQMQMSFQETDLNRLVVEAATRFKPTAEEQGVTLAATQSDSASIVKGDSTQLARAVGLMVENAIAHTPEAGHVAINVKRERWSGGDFATIQVKDTGMGIAADALPHIFERFYRSDRARDSGIRGVGLGLAIAHEIIDRHNGYITVESEINQGSAFTIWLPVFVAPNQNTP